MRIVSLLPSATDIVVGLGAGSNLVGVSHSCTGDWQHLPKLTRTWIDTAAPSAVIDAQVSNANRALYELDITTLERLSPDVVVSQSLCDVCAVPSGDVLQAIESLPQRPILVDLAPANLSDIPDCIARVGDAVGRQQSAKELIEDWHQTFKASRRRFANRNLRVVFLDWLDPPFVAGHWIPDMLEWIGIESVLGHKGEPSYAVSWDRIREANPDLVVAACCGFDVARTSSEFGDTGMHVEFLDGHELFSRPSPALATSLAHLCTVIEKHLDRR